MVAPPFVFLDQVKGSLKPQVQVAAQNCWAGKGGAFTGEVSAEMLTNLSIPWVILGHSERRCVHCTCVQHVLPAAQVALPTL